MADVLQIELSAGGRVLRLTEATARAFGARLCFGDPVQHGTCTVIPVATLSTAGGFGFGNSAGGETPNEGGGGGGLLGARPVGFIEIGEAGARFQRVVTTADLRYVVSWLAVAAMLFRRRRRRGSSAAG